MSITITTRPISLTRTARKNLLICWRTNVICKRISSSCQSMKFTDSSFYRIKRCTDRVFTTFEALRMHIRKQHDLFFCDLCVTHIKVRNFVKVCQTRKFKVIETYCSCFHGKGRCIIRQRLASIDGLETKMHHLIEDIRSVNIVIRDSLIRMRCTSI